MLLGGDEIRGSGLPDVLWLRPDGDPMGGEDWERDDARVLAVLLNGEEIPTHDRDGNPIEVASLVIIFNGHHDPVEFALSEALEHHWKAEPATAGDPPHDQLDAGGTVTAEGRSVTVLRRVISGPTT